MTRRLSLEEDAMRHALARALRSRGVDVIAALEAGMIARQDEPHLEYATVQGCVLYSLNVRDFYRLHSAFLAQGKGHAGIMLAPQQRYAVGEQMRRLLTLSAAKSAADMQHQVEFLSACEG